MRQRPPAGARLTRPIIAGGLWLPGMHGGVSDAAGCNAPATVIGGVSRVAGPFGAPALKFDNATGYVDCGRSGNTAFNWSSGAPFARTFWCWVRRPSSSSVGPLFAKGNNTALAGWNLSVTTTGLQVGFVASNNTRISTTNVLSVGDWHHVGIVWGGDMFAQDGGAIYLDGKVTGLIGNLIDGNQTSVDTFNLWIGHAQYVGGNAGAISAWADLEIDHWGFDRRLYGPGEMADLYARPFRDFAAPALYRRLRGVRSNVRPVAYAIT